MRFGFDAFAPFLSDGFWAPGDVASAPPPPAVIAVNPPPPPRRSEVEERPTVEITASGVQIVRGPGSRHTGW